MKHTMSTDIETFLFDLSRELHIEGTQGVAGNELELIALVRNCPFLYDKSRNDFKDLAKRETAWKAIATVMHSSIVDCQARWKSLREQYGRIKRTLSTNDPDAERLLQWEFLDDMKFLDNHIIPRRTFKSVNVETEDEDEDHNFRIKWPDDFKSIENREQKLISLVKQCPLIYDRNNVDYRDANKKEQVWMSISKAIGRSVLDCKCRWKTLRERYARERKLKIDDSSRKSWEYFDLLSFLDSHVRSRRSSFRSILPKSQFGQSLLNSNPNIVLSSNLSDNDISFHVQKLEFVDPTYQTTIKDPDPITMSPNSGTSQSVSEMSGQAPAITHASVQQTQDEDDLFGLSIAAELRRISGRRKKMRLKAEIFKLLCDAASEESE